MIEKILNALGPIIAEIIEKVIELLFDAVIKKNGDTGKMIVASLYPIIDVELEEMTGKTKTEVDDAVIKGVLLGIENVAKKHGIILSNVDND